MAEAKNEDGLFLLEALVDKVVFTKAGSLSDREFRTCVSLQCRAVEPLEICDDDAPGAASSPHALVRHFNSGKSCLFSLKQAEINEALSRFPIRVTVYKALPCGCLPTKIVIGEATIDMTKEFVRARQKFYEDPSAISYEALKDTFTITGPDNSEAGEVALFLRITCFGSMIITRFQGSGAPTALGSSGGVTRAERTCTAPQEQPTRDKCACGAAPPCIRGMDDHIAGKTTTSAGFVVCPTTAVYQTKTPPPVIGSPSNASTKGSVQQVAAEPHCPNSAAGGGRGACPTALDPYNSMPCVQPSDPCFCCGPKPGAKEPMLCRNTDQYCLHVPKGRTKQFEEIGTNLNGNELKIKVPASASIIKKISQTHCAMQRPYTKGEGEGTGAGGGPCAPPCGKNQISMGLPSEATCCRGARPQTTQFTCTTEGCTQASKHGQQAAMARGEKAKTELVNTNVFVLKVAKTAMQGDRKCKLELELVTPKGPDKEVPVEKITRRMQCDPDCDCNRLKKPQKKKKLY